MLTHIFSTGAWGRRWLAVCFVVLLTVVSAAAQPTLNWQRYLGAPLTGEYGTGTLRLSATRLVTTGSWESADYDTYRALLIFTRPNGDTINVSFTAQLPTVGDWMSPVAADNGDFYIAGGAEDTLPNGTVEYPSYICRFDSLGNVRWSHRYVVSGLASVRRIVALPDGVLVVSLVPGTLSGRAELRRLDGQGNVRWVRYFNTSAQDLTALADGSYAVLTNGRGPYPPPWSFWTTDMRIYKVSPQGDSITDVFVGDSGANDIGNRLQVTTDGGLVVVGQQSVQPSTTPRRGILRKLDANWQEQWRYSFQPPTGNYQAGGEYFDVHELVTGNFLLTGTPRNIGRLDEVAAPGTNVWTWTPPPATGGIIPQGVHLLYDAPTTSWRLTGSGSQQFPGMGRRDLWLASLGNLPAPAVVNYCTIPPGPPVASFQAVGGPSTLRFTLDRAATPAGPLYAEISRVTWDFGDGSPLDTGLVVTHTYASPASVRVRCTVTNNLFCTSTADLWPLGVDEDAALAAAVSIWPNPSATGRFAVRAPRGATYTVFDATGRAVVTGRLMGEEGAIRLTEAAPGVYALRLAWADGRTLTRRLVR